MYFKRLCTSFRYFCVENINSLFSVKTLKIYETQIIGVNEIYTLIIHNSQYFRRKQELLLEINLLKDEIAEISQDIGK